ncbi:MAG: L-lactate permease [Edaphobacter sp.]
MTMTFYETGMRLWCQHFSSKPVLHWMQDYDPTHHWWLSTAWAALPLLVLLITMVGFKWKAHLSALLSLGVALVIATVVFHMPVSFAGLAAVYGAGYGLFPIFWIIFPVILPDGDFGISFYLLSGTYAISSGRMRSSFGMARNCVFRPS